jgi:hypothetical protein
MESEILGERLLQTDFGPEWTVRVGQTRAGRGLGLVMILDMAVFKGKATLDLHIELLGSLQTTKKFRQKWLFAISAIILRAATRDTCSSELAVKMLWIWSKKEEDFSLSRIAQKKDRYEARSVIVAF